MTTESAPGTQQVTQKRSKINQIADSGPFNHQFTQHLQRVLLGNLPLAGAVAEDEFGVLRRAPPFLFAPEQILHSRRLSDRVIQSCTMSAS